MAPKTRDPAWAYVEMVESSMHCKFCHRLIKDGPGGINRLKLHLAGIRGQITPCESPELGEVRQAMLANIEKFKQDKARQKEIQAEIGRKREIQRMMASNPHYDFEDSCSIPQAQTNASNPFRYVPPSQDKGKGRMRKGDCDVTIKSFFTPASSPSDAHGPEIVRPQMQPTLDDHWKKELRETACDYIARWWYDADIPFNAACSPYYEPMFEAIHAAGKGFKGPTMHELRGVRLQKEIDSINEYLQEFKNSWARTGCTVMSDGWTDRRNRTIINFLVFCPQGTMFLKSVDASDKSEGSCGSSSERKHICIAVVDSSTSLTTPYQSINESRKMVLKEQLKNIWVTNAESVVHYLGWVRYVRDDLTAIGETIAPTKLVRVVLKNRGQTGWDIQLCHLEGQNSDSV
eukprot:PITA_32515